MAKTMEHLSDFVFVTVANSTLARRDAYLSHLKSGIKPDTLAALRTAPLQMTTLFPDEVLKQAEQDIATFESKNQPLSNKKGRFHPYERTEKHSDNRKPERPAWKCHRVQICKTLKDNFSAALISCKQLVLLIACD